MFKEDILMRVERELYRGLPIYITGALIGIGAMLASLTSGDGFGESMGNGLVMGSPRDWHRP